MSASDAVEPNLPQRLPGDPEWLWRFESMEMIGYGEAWYHYQLGTACTPADAELVVGQLEAAERAAFIEGFRFYFAVMVPGPDGRYGSWT